MVFSTTKTDRHDITEILLKVALNIITTTLDYKLNSVDSYDFSTFYTILPRKIIKDKFSQVFKWSFRKSGWYYISFKEYASCLVMIKEINTAIGPDKIGIVSHFYGDGKSVHLYFMSYYITIFILYLISTNR